MDSNSTLEITYTKLHVRLKVAFFIVMLSVIMLDVVMRSVIMLSVGMRSVIMLSVVAPRKWWKSEK